MLARMGETAIYHDSAQARRLLTDPAREPHGALQAPGRGERRSPWSIGLCLGFRWRLGRACRCRWSHGSGAFAPGIRRRGWRRWNTLRASGCPQPQASAAPPPRGQHPRTAEKCQWPSRGRAWLARAGRIGQRRGNLGAKGYRDPRSLLAFAGAELGGAVMGVDLPSARHRRRSWETRLSRTVTAAADMSTLMRLPPQGVAHRHDPVLSHAAA
jgi:hypothetical protein